MTPNRIVWTACLALLAASASASPPPTIQEYLDEQRRRAEMAENCNPDTVICLRMRERRRVDPTCRYPTYPVDSLKEDEQGDTVVDLMIDERGRVHEVVVVQSSGYSRLDGAAVVSFSRCVFPAEVALHSGAPAPYRIQLQWRTTDDVGQGSITGPSAAMLRPRPPRNLGVPSR